MFFIDKIKIFFLKLFKRKKTQHIFQEEINIEYGQTDETKKDENQFEYKNIIFEKIKYLEQYIKIFSMIFPEEYKYYLNLIDKQKKDYNDELANYEKGFDGVITFSIDPERDSKRMAQIMQLESDIKYFVEVEVNFNTYREKFSLLCFKLNQFYNALLNTKLSNEISIKQLQNAKASLLNILEVVKEFRFFKTDSRKRELILDYVIYCDYVLFKASLRLSLVKSLSEYVKNESQVYTFFEKSYLDKVMSTYLIYDLEKLQLFLVNNICKLNNKILIDISQELQYEITSIKTTTEQEQYFSELIRFENTVNTNANLSNIAFEIEIPSRLNVKNNEQTVNEIAIYILNLVEGAVAKVISKVITNFKHEISWREFYFMCKVFEIDDDVKLLSSRTIYDNVEKQFLKLDSKYSKYSDEYVKTSKAKLLKQSTKKVNQKYILFYEFVENEANDFKYELDKLQLDYVISENKLYINHSYFNGFANLEQNFCNIQTF